jgi:glucan phosphoethanolaminetransferase (alkaline phosphatase superfamily)
MIGDVSVLAIIAATLLAVAFGNVWYTFLGTAPSESLRATAVRVAVYFVFFFALAQLVPLIHRGQVSFLTVAVFTALFSMHQYPYLIPSGESIMQRTLVHVGHAIGIALGGLSIITYWPW